MRILFISLFFGISASLGGCLVTDEVEFEDDVNHPPQMLSVSPSNSYFHWTTDGTTTVSARVWDPDEEDLDTLKAAIYFVENPYSSSATFKGVASTTECSITSLEPSDEELDDGITGTVLNVSCDIEMGDVFNNSDVALIKMVVSDLGFRTWTVEKGARTVEAQWVYQLIEL